MTAIYEVTMFNSPARAIEAWPNEPRRRVAAALAKSPSLMSLRDIEKGIRAGSATLWDVRDAAGKSVGSFVTEVVLGGVGAAVNILALGGTKMKAWIGLFSDAVASYAARMGCVYVVEMGRPGWTKVLSPLGWVPGPSVMLKVV